MKGDEDDGNFVNGNMPVPVGCYSILLARLQREQVGAKTSFAQTREELNQKVQRSPGDANLLSQCVQRFKHVRSDGILVNYRIPGLPETG